MAKSRIRAAAIAASGHWGATPGGPVPYFTKAELVAAQREAEEMDYNQQINPEALPGLADDGKFPVTVAIPHERGAIIGEGGTVVRPAEEYGPQIRCRVILDAKGGVAMLDITPQRFDRLPWTG